MSRNWLVRHGASRRAGRGGLCLAADAAHVAGAQGRLDARYTATLPAFRSARAPGSSMSSTISSPPPPAARPPGSCAFSPADTAPAPRAAPSTAASRCRRAIPRTSSATSKSDDVRIALAGGNVKDFAVEPPLPPHPDRIPVTEAHRRDVIDPMTVDARSRAGQRRSAVAGGLQAQGGGVRRPHALRPAKLRSSAWKRSRPRRATRGRSSSARSISRRSRAIVPDRPTIKYLVELRDAEVWLAPIAGTRVLVPFRFSLPTPLGLGVLQATQFVSSALPSRADRDRENAVTVPAIHRAVGLDSCEIGDPRRR